MAETAPAATSSAPVPDSAQSKSSQSKAEASPATDGAEKGTESSQASGQETKSQSTPPPEPQKFKRKLKIYGEEKEFEATEDELWSKFRHETAVEVRQQKLAAQEKELARKLEEIRGYEESIKDPSGLRELAKKMRPDTDPVETMTDILLAELEEKSMTPEQRELFQLRAEKQALEEKELAREEAEKKEAFGAEVARRSDDVGRIFANTLKKMGFPADDLTLSIMAGQYYSNKQDGIELSEDELGEATAKMLDLHHDARLSGFEGETLLDRYPKAAAAFNAALVARYRRLHGANTQQAPRVVAPKPQEPSRPKMMSDLETFRAMGIRGLRTI